MCQKDPQVERRIKELEKDWSSFWELGALIEHLR